MLKKLQRKFILLTTGISVVVLILIAATINIANYVSLRNDSDELLTLLIENDMSIDNNMSALERFAKEIAFTTRYFVVRVDSQNDVGFIDTKMISSVTAEQAATYAQDVYSSGNADGFIGNFRYARTETDYGYTYIFLDIEEELAIHYDYMFFSTIIVFIAVILILVFSILLSKKAVAPIANSYEKQKRFITDVSHELKTPLAIIKADSDVIELDVGESEWTNSINKQVSRLNTLIENLITLTKMEEQRAQSIGIEFSLSDVVRQEIFDFSSSAKNASLNIFADIVDGVNYRGEEPTIRKLIQILTENAIKYALPETDIRVGLRVSGNKKIFTMENSVEDISIGWHNDWFERFYREDKARNSEAKGYGIGLSVARAVCDKHGAKITAESRTGKEVLITVVF